MAQHPKFSNSSKKKKQDDNNNINNNNNDNNNNTAQCKHASDCNVVQIGVVSCCIFFGSKSCFVIADRGYIAAATVAVVVLVVGVAMICWSCCCCCCHCCCYCCCCSWLKCCSLTSFRRLGTCTQPFARKDCNLRATLSALVQMKQCQKAVLLSLVLLAGIHDVKSADTALRGSNKQAAIPGQNLSDGVGAFGKVAAQHADLPFNVSDQLQEVALENSSISSNLTDEMQEVTPEDDINLALNSTEIEDLNKMSEKVANFIVCPYGVICIGRLRRQYTRGPRTCYGRLVCRKPR